MIIYITHSSCVVQIVVEEGQTALHISQVYADDCGTYSVLARNLGGEARTSCLLSTDAALAPAPGRAPCKPEWIQPLEHKDVTEGSRARLECVCTGYPQPEVSRCGRSWALRPTIAV